MAGELHLAVMGRYRNRVAMPAAEGQPEIVAGRSRLPRLACRRPPVATGLDPGPGGAGESGTTRPGGWKARFVPAPVPGRAGHRGLRPPPSSGHHRLNSVRQPLRVASQPEMLPRAVTKTQGGRLCLRAYRLIVVYA